MYAHCPSWFHGFVCLHLSPFVVFVKASRDLRLCNDLHGWKLVTNESDHWKTQGPGIQQDPTHLHPLPWPWFRDDRRCFEYTFFFLHVLWKLNQTIECIRTDYYAFALLHRSGRTRTEPSCIYNYLPDTAAKALLFNSQCVFRFIFFGKGFRNFHAMHSCLHEILGVMVWSYVSVLSQHRRLSDPEDN